MNLLVISGPTATGKTKLAIKLAQRFNGEIVSADSRQVYKGMDIATGKDLPVNVKCQMSNVKLRGKNLSYYLNNKIRIWGLDLVNPDEEFSVTHYVQFATSVILDIHKRDKLPIVVGGTGLYIKALLEPLANIHIPPNRKLRKELENVSVTTLQKKLKALDKKKYKSMNHSDRNNPRRLIRVIEVALSNLACHCERSEDTSDVSKQSQYVKRDRHSRCNIGIAMTIMRSSSLVICLTAPKEILKEKIDTRVEKRIKQNVIKEVQELVKKGYSWNLPSMSGLGYRQWKPLFSNPKSQISMTKDNKVQIKEIVERWKVDEYKYAKRQLTWFKKQKNINWFDITKTGWKKEVVDLISKWYTENKRKTQSSKLKATT